MPLDMNRKKKEKCPQIPFPGKWVLHGLNLHIGTWLALMISDTILFIGHVFNTNLSSKNGKQIEMIFPKECNNKTSFVRFSSDLLVFLVFFALNF